MNRRGFLLTSASAGAAALLSPVLSNGATVEWADASYAAFPQSYVVEFRVTPPQQQAVLQAVAALSKELQGRTGYLGATLKQMQGESTMVKNYPPVFKGVLAAASAESAAEGRLPYANVLFLRFANATELPRAELDAWVQNRLAPHVQFTPPGAAKPLEFTPLTGVYATVIAGDRHEIHDSPTAIAQFLGQQDDTPQRKLVTVINHVMVPDTLHAELEAKVGPLLKVAQNTFEPKDDPNGVGQPGSRDNRDYRKAVSTEILVNTQPYGSLRNYLMHGVWESVWDHENSHLDPRFQHAFMAVAPYVVSGPVEPFYHTLFLENRA
ncbi:hypothetical protein [Candidatus Igneacidithiobacillus taiwanensis]|uniref:hypothetical protein n=1 Tax=Candidatus Igneacidithiobacillus taiwanensis TaxID=1945924 RepID=UPI0028A2264C|nr:hypothetical protein [Candidatus Igneacidithiobacillus taiwanensis]MCE5360822.1 hypothetical protein [Acidithiobacillus sp.]